MSDSQKRPGARDISDLKARLGLKKQVKKKPSRGGVVPAPGAPLPAPPGAEPPQPTASSDPFGAMNLAAAQAALKAAQRGPEIIVVEKGEEVENVDHKSNILRYLKIAGMIVAPLVVGVAVGQISSSAKTYNKTIRDSGHIQEDVKRIRKSMLPVQYAFLEAKKNGFKTGDDELTQALEAASKEMIEPDPTIVYKSWLYELDTTLVGDVLNFYSSVVALKSDLNTHLKLTKLDDKALLTDAVEKLKDAKPKETESGYMLPLPYRFGAVVEIPTQQDLQDPKSHKAFGARVVELSAPICQDNKPSDTGECPGPIKGYRYRVDPDGPWGLKELAPAQPGQTTTESDKLLVVQPTGVFDALIKNNQPSVAELYYKKRVTSLSQKTDELIELGTMIEGKLKAKASESKKFTFFL